MAGNHISQPWAFLVLDLSHVMLAGESSLSRGPCTGAARSVAMTIQSLINPPHIGAAVARRQTLPLTHGWRPTPAGHAAAGPCSASAGMARSMCACCCAILGPAHPAHDRCPVYLPPYSQHSSQANTCLHAPLQGSRILLKAYACHGNPMS